MVKYSIHDIHHLFSYSNLYNKHLKKIINEYRKDNIESVDIYLFALHMTESLYKLDINEDDKNLNLLEKYLSIIRTLFEKDNYSNMTESSKKFFIKYLNACINDLSNGFDSNAFNFLSMTLNKDESHKWIKIMMDIDDMNKQSHYKTLKMFIDNQYASSTDMILDTKYIEKYFDYNFLSLNLKTEVTRLIDQMNIISLFIKNNDIHPCKIMIDNIYKIDMDFDNIFMSYYNNIPMILKVSPFVTNGNEYFKKYSLIHEYLVGKEMNKLRRDIPNFIYTYGITKSTSPFTTLDIYKHTPISFMFREDDDYQLYIEYMPYSKTLYSCLKSCDQIQCYNKYNDYEIMLCWEESYDIILIQLLTTMIYAYEMNGFVQWDPNLKNFMIVDLKQVRAINIKYPIIKDGKVIRFDDKFIMTNKLLVYIDYGLSSIKNEYIYQLYGVDMISPAFPYVYYGHLKFESSLITLLRLMIHMVIETRFFMEKTEKDIEYNLFNLLYYIYMGQNYDRTNDDDFTNVFSFMVQIYDFIDIWTIRPNTQYYLYDAIKMQLEKYDQYIFDTTLNYSSILPNEDINIDNFKSDDEIIIDTPKKWYIYHYMQKVNNIDLNYNINIDKILNDQTIIKNIISHPEYYTKKIEKYSPYYKSLSNEDIAFIVIISYELYIYTRFFSKTLSHNPIIESINYEDHKCFKTNIRNIIRELNNVTKNEMNLPYNAFEIILKIYKLVYK